MQVHITTRRFPMPALQSHVLLTVHHDSKLSPQQVAQHAAQRMWSLDGVTEAGAMPLADMTIVSTSEYQALLFARTKLEALKLAV